MTAFQNDLINGSFELLGATLLAVNVVRIMQDKIIRGVSWLPVGFFTAWGFWNLHYYPSLDQWCSFVGGCCIVTMNLAWLILVFYYRRRRNE